MTVLDNAVGQSWVRFVNLKSEAAEVVSEIIRKIGNLLNNNISKLII